MIYFRNGDKAMKTVISCDLEGTKLQNENGKIITLPIRKAPDRDKLLIEAEVDIEDLRAIIIYLDGEYCRRNGWLRSFQIRG